MDDGSIRLHQQNTDPLNHFPWPVVAYDIGRFTEKLQLYSLSIQWFTDRRLRFSWLAVITFLIERAGYWFCLSTNFSNGGSFMKHKRYSCDKEEQNLCCPVCDTRIELLNGKHRHEPLVNQLIKCTRCSIILEHVGSSSLQVLLPVSRERLNQIQQLKRPEPLREPRLVELLDHVMKHRKMPARRPYGHRFRKSSLT